jgi:hypothetical protein
MLVLGKQVVANARTLEQKIADAGPAGMRIDPHVLTPARRELQDEGLVQAIKRGNNTWYHLANANPEAVEARLAETLKLFREFTANNLPGRLGQTLEIATYRALMTVPDLEFYGRFSDLDAHDDATIYSKVEPPNHIGARVLPGDRRLDFMVRHPEAGYLGLECKNIREWLYPDRDEITDLLLKCTALNCVPVLIGRRIPFVTFKVLTTAGVIVHQTYNQLLPAADAPVADRIKHKDGLGYHDIRLGNQPDGRLTKFITANMMNVAPDAREKMDQFLDLLTAFGSGDMNYTEFAARVRRRSRGQKEDNDWPEEEEPDSW